MGIDSAWYSALESAMRGSGAWEPRQDVGIARGFKAMSTEQMQQLHEGCRPSSGDGHLELYKTTKKYDGSVAREQHGYPPAEQLPL
jgi:hypothetical protein